MKKLFSLLSLLFVGAAAAFAQYMPSTEGEVLKFKATDFENNKTEEYEAKVVKVTNADGVTTAEIVEVHKSPVNPLETLEQNITYKYNEAEQSTVLTLMTAADYKHMVVSSIKEMISASGQYVSPQQVAEIENSLKPKGEISFVLPAKVEAGQTFPNSSIRCTFMGQAMGMKAVKGSYLGYEEVEVPAGKFNCIKLTYTMSIIGEGSDARVTMWVAPGVGVVKQSTANKKGKELGVEELVSSTKP